MDYKISSTNRLSGHLVDSFVKYSCDCAVKEDAYRTSDKKRFYSSSILQAFHLNVFFFASIEIYTRIQPLTPYPTARQRPLSPCKRARPKE